MLRTQITLGIILMLASIGALAYTGFNEEARMATATESQLARRIENGAILFHNNCARCHGDEAQGVPGLCPPLNSIALLEQRVEETGWAGSVHNYIVDAIRGGRLISTRPDQYFGEAASGMAMPFWSQDYGGPLRNDQIEDIALFIQNYTEAPAAMDEGEDEEPIAADADLVEVGLQLYQENGCVGCHQLDAAGANAAVGPTHNGMGAIAAERIEQGDYSGEATTAEEYIRESIVNPGAYVVEGYNNVMPAYGSLSEDKINALVQMLLEQ